MATRFTRIDRTHFSQRHFARLRGLAHCNIDEVCGILVGRIENNIAYVEQLRRIKNIAEYPLVSFKFDPQEYYDAIKDTDWFEDSAPYTLLGIWHTHPNYPGYPSSIDWEAAVKGNVIEGAYLIFTTRGDDVYSYYWDGTQFTVLRQT